MKTAIVADWLVTYGGAEHVLAELRALFPSAPIFTTVAKHDALGPLRDADIRTTGLQRMYRLTGNHQVLLSMMPRAIESIDLTGYDLIVSSSHAVGKGIVPPARALHVCYCHTPMRYAWEMEDDYLRDFRVPGFLRNAVKKRLRDLRRRDLTTAQRTDLFIANSTTTAERIERIYGRKSVVIGPPADERFFVSPSPSASGHSLPDGSTVNSHRSTEDCKPSTVHCSPEKKIPETNRTRGETDYFLAVGRMVPYKRFDLLIACANALKFPLKIAGRGQDEARLKAMAGPTVEFLGHVPDDALPGLYANAKALLFPQYEDAGIVPLEAQACGTPVIAFAAGGATDAVRDGVTGLFFPEQTDASLRDALARFDARTWDRAAIRAHAAGFTQDRFRSRVKEEIENAYDAFSRGTFARS